MTIGTIDASKHVDIEAQHELNRILNNMGEATLFDTTLNVLRRLVHQTADLGDHHICASAANSIESLRMAHDLQHLDRSA